MSTSINRAMQFSSVHILFKDARVFSSRFDISQITSQRAEIKLVQFGSDSVELPWPSLILEVCRSQP